MTESLWRFPVRNVERVVDGDTVDLEVDVGFRLRSTQRFRLDGVDTPEIFGVSKDSHEYERGRAAQGVTRRWLLDHGVHDLAVVCSGEQSFGRWVADVECEEDDVSLVEHLEEQGYGGQQ